jgi:excisionase family DNA binding protein
MERSTHLLRAIEVAHQLGIARSTVYQLAQDGQLRCVRITERVIRFEQSAIDDFIRSRSAEAELAR